ERPDAGADPPDPLGRRAQRTIRGTVAAPDLCHQWSLFAGYGTPDVPSRRYRTVAGDQSHLTESPDASARLLLHSATHRGWSPRRACRRYRRAPGRHLRAPVWRHYVPEMDRRA